MSKIRQTVKAAKAKIRVVFKGIPDPLDGYPLNGGHSRHSAAHTMLAHFVEGEKGLGVPKKQCIYYVPPHFYPSSDISRSLSVIFDHDPKHVEKTLSFCFGEVSRFFAPSDHVHDEEECKTFVVDIRECNYNLALMSLSP